MHEMVVGDGVIPRTLAATRAANCWLCILLYITTLYTAYAPTLLVFPSPFRTELHPMPWEEHRPSRPVERSPVVRSPVVHSAQWDIKDLW